MTMLSTKARESIVCLNDPRWAEFRPDDWQTTTSKFLTVSF